MNPDSTRLFRAASGFGDLEMWQDAWDELEELPPEDLSELDVGVLRVAILNALKRWEPAAILAEMLLEGEGAKIGDLYLSAAYAVRRARSLPEAKALLLRGEPFLGEQPLWHFNLACYECQLGDLEAAKARLARAFMIDPSYRRKAMEDEDLRPLWYWIRGPMV